MREARRLALLERQRLIADVARKQALRGLAEALEAEARGAALAERSRLLVAAGAPRAGATTGAALQARAGFTAGLAQLAAHARDGAEDARRQSAWATEALAQAETRARRLGELTAEARAALAAAKERREQARGLPLARKLHSSK
ncbi:hypothetical protein ACLBKU_04290 [Erythrobacter sp. NE805]|uniref:hypothetical protein n=1 Tax=Erythrobacter sp. NE805 TaxID=3389875 RepID=UPI00396B3DD7